MPQAKFCFLTKVLTRKLLEMTSKLPFLSGELSDPHASLFHAEENDKEVIVILTGGPCFILMTLSNQIEVKTILQTKNCFVLACVISDA